MEINEWAHRKADEVQQAIFEKYKYFPIGGEIIAEALFNARLGALEEAAKIADALEEHSFDASSDLTASAIANDIRALKDKP